MYCQHQICQGIQRDDMEVNGPQCQQACYLECTTITLIDLQGVCAR